MPEITRFYGIVIKMFFKPKEHEPSHIHALYGEYVGIFDLHTMEILVSNISRPERQKKKPTKRNSRQKHTKGAEHTRPICKEYHIQYKKSIIKETV